MCISIVKNPVLSAIYTYDTDLFVSAFCENQERPQLKCNGRCMLAKMQNEQSEKDASNMLKQLQAEMVYCNYNSSSYVYGLVFSIDKNIDSDSYVDQIYSFQYISYLVDPPELNFLFS